MVMLAGAKWRHMLCLGAGGLALGAYYAWSEPYRRALFEPLVVDRFDLLHSKVGVNFLGAVCVVVDVKHPASDPFPDLNYPIFPEIVAEKEI